MESFENLNSNRHLNKVKISYYEYKSVCKKKKKAKNDYDDVKFFKKLNVNLRISIMRKESAGFSDVV